MEKNDLIYIIGMPKDQLRALKALRAAVKLLDPSLQGAGALEHAQVIWDLFHKDGFTFFGMTDDAQITKSVQEALEVGKIESKVNIDPIAHAASLAKTPEEVFANEAAAMLPPPPTQKERQAKTGLSLLAWSDGDPISACAFAASLGRTTGELKFFEGVLIQIVDAFPWIMERLKEQGIFQ